MSYKIIIHLVIFFLVSAYSTGQLSAQTDIDDFYYHPVQGREIGMAPNEDNRSPEEYLEYKTNWGFKKIRVLVSKNNYEEYYFALDAGYEPEEVMIIITRISYKYAVDDLEAGFYFISEPVEHDCFGNPSSGGLDSVYTPEQLTDIKNKIDTVRENSIMVLDGYKRCSHLKIAGDITDAIMYSSYNNWDELDLPVCNSNFTWGEQVENAWLKRDELQIDSWRDMKEIFEKKYYMTWMDGRGEEYDALFKEADKLNLTKIWYWGGGGMDSLEAFCNTAWQNGWLDKLYFLDFYSPYNLTAQEIDPGVIYVGWEDSTDYALGYVIERKTSSDTLFYPLDSLEAGSVVYSDSNIVNNQTYFYRIYSYTEERHSSVSDTISITASADSIAAPSDLNAQQIENIVELEWNDNSENKTGFYIERMRDKSDAFEIIDSTMSDTGEYRDSSIVENGMYHYRIYAANEYTRSDYSDTAVVEFVITSIEENSQPYNFELHQNYPNPFNPSTVIQYSIPYAGTGHAQSLQHAALVIYDILGCEVATLVNKSQSPGNYEVLFDASSLSSGIYYYSLNVSGRTITKKMLLLR